MKSKRLLWAGVMLALLSGTCAVGETRNTLAPPSQLLDGLYAAVAASGIFPDFKQFADAVPREAPHAVLAAYRRERPKAKAALQAFVSRHFRLQQPAVTPPPARGLPIDKHIAALWPLLTREMRTVPRYSSLLPLPKPFIVPGGRFTEIYYWDSYFTMLGLGAKNRAVRDDMVADFAYLIRTYGHVPNGNRTYYLSRSQPPFFFAMVALAGRDGTARAYARYLPELKGEYAYWMRGEKQATPGHPVRNVVRLPDGATLNRNWDERDTPRDEEYPKDVGAAAASHQPASRLYRNIRAAAESGWDFSSRWLADGETVATIDTTDIVPVDLNSLLYGLERAIQSGCREKHEPACAREFAARATRRRTAMDKYLWDGTDGAFFDYDWRSGKSTGVLSAATLYPLFVKLASDAQAVSVSQTVQGHLLKPGGIDTTETHTGQQWDAPNGWAPLQWIAVRGLLDYGQNDAADTVATRWLRTVINAYDASGRLVEKYDVENPDRRGGGGEYPLQDGFGWTNGVTVALMRLCPLAQPAAADGSRHCAHH